MACQRLVKVAEGRVRDYRSLRCMEKSEKPFARRKSPSEGARWRHVVTLCGPVMRVRAPRPSHQHHHAALRLSRWGGPEIRYKNMDITETSMTYSPGYRICCLCCDHISIENCFPTGADKGRFEPTPTRLARLPVVLSRLPKCHARSCSKRACSTWTHGTDTIYIIDSTEDMTMT